MEDRKERSAFGLREVGEDLQDLSQAALNLASDLFQLGSRIVTLPFRLLPEETQIHLGEAAREAGYAVQSLFDEAINAGSRAIQGLNEGFANMSDQANDDDSEDLIIVYEEIVVDEAASNEAGSSNDEASVAAASEDSSNQSADLGSIEAATDGRSGGSDIESSGSEGGFEGERGESF